MSPTYDDLAKGLLDATSAGRTTIRVIDSDGGFPVVAEATARGVRPIRDTTDIDLHKAETVVHIKRTHEPLLQEDLEHAIPQVPRQLIELYGVKAQMLGPVVVSGTLVGIVSVHDVAGPREWSTEDRSALVRTATTVEHIIRQ